MAEERLQKVLAAAGVASRRACEELMVAGRVQVNGRTVTELGTKVDPEKVEVTVDGRPIQLPKHYTYIKLYKPRNMLSDIGGDARGRATVEALLPPDAPRVFPVGRLDLNSEGLMLFTDDGDLAHRLTHPRYSHPKTYYVLVEKRPSLSALEQLQSGVDLPEGRSAPAQVEPVAALPDDLILAPGPLRGIWLRFVLREGKKRQIRHMTGAVGLPTLRLIRWAIGPLTLAKMEPGQWSYVNQAELQGLRDMVAGRSRRGARPGGGRRPTGRPPKPRRKNR
jgi:23S rRNA pseudouridine2605 synthase